MAFTDGHGHWQTLALYRLDSVDFHGIHGTAFVDVQLANPGSIRVDLDSVDFHGTHGTAKICGFPWALAKPGTNTNTEDQGSLHPWH